MLFNKTETGQGDREEKTNPKLALDLQIISVDFQLLYMEINGL